MIYVISMPCVNVEDRACVEECPADCTYEGNRMLYVHPTECVGCGTCAPVCPADAISYEDDMPAGMTEFVAINAGFFDEVGSTGGAASFGIIDLDHPLVAAISTEIA